MRKYDNDDLVLQFEDKGLKLQLFWDGNRVCSYIFSKNDTELMRGDDYKPSIMYSPDERDSIIALLSFMVVRPGNTDKEYFKDHTPQMMEWLKSDERDEVNMMVSDYESGPAEDQDNEDETPHYNNALAYFKEHIKTEF